MATGTYLYCVRKPKAGRNKKTAAKPPKGLAGAKEMRVLAADDYELVVATVPLAKYSAEVIEPRLRDLDWVSGCASAHEAVVEHAALGGTVVPAKLFTIFGSDERAVAHVLRGKKELARVIARIEGCDEWGLRILFDEAAAAKAELAEVARAQKKAAPSGTGFLLRKKAQTEVKRRLVGDARAEADDLYEVLAKRAKRSLRRPPPSQDLAARVLLDAVFLVETKASKGFTAAVGKTAQRLADDGFHVTLTGPWPAYSFIGGR